MGNLENNYLQLKKAILESEFSRMNSMQLQAVFQTYGPLLILAGAGSGKTTVLVNRIAYMVKYGNAYNSNEIPADLDDDMIQYMHSALDNKDFSTIKNLIADCPIKPWNILAITFTNKAAGELKERLEKTLGEDANNIWASTFHSSCARILRRDADRIGYSKHFTVYDTDDQKRIVKDCQKQFSLDDKVFPYRTIMSEISRAKDKMLSPADYAQSIPPTDARLKKMAEVYSLYQRKLKEADAMDFDDLLFLTVKLLRENSDVLEYYQNKFKYILVDEYQDTNGVQFEFVNLIAKKNKNLCVVGDDDQSIYKFRGANIENILNFEKYYTTAKVIRLEQNYRSTQTILDAANAVISNNTERKGKNLWTSNGVGEKISVHTSLNELSETKFIADIIIKEVNENKRKYSDFACLYRMNAQSSTIERMFVKAGIPYRIIGGFRFYERKEIRDMIAYLSIISNPYDEVRLRRIINVPKRSIGDKTVGIAIDIAHIEGISLYEVLQHADEYEALKRSASKILAFTKMINKFMEMAEDDDVSLSELYSNIIDEIGIKQALRDVGDEAETRIENIEELKSNIMHYEEENGEEASLSGFLEDVSLMTDIDNYDADADCVILMTLHSAKGLEFPVVFLPGMEENIFPSFQVLSDPTQIEEERRLAYVGITRAKEKLYISNAVSRLVFGSSNRNKLSRFATEIPEELVDRFIERDWKKLSPDQETPKSSKENRAIMQESAQKIGIGTQKATSNTKYSVGEVVLHPKFGKGMVTFTKVMGNDMMLEVAFEDVGTKKLMANFAKLKKVEG